MPRHGLGNFCIIRTNMDYCDFCDQSVIEKQGVYEKYSPYKIMADSSLRDNLNPEQWQQQKELSKSMLNK